MAKLAAAVARANELQDRVSGDRTRGAVKGLIVKPVIVEETGHVVGVKPVAIAKRESKLFDLDQDEAPKVKTGGSSKVSKPSTKKSSKSAEIGSTPSSYSAVDVVKAKRTTLAQEALKEVDIKPVSIEVKRPDNGDAPASYNPGNVLDAIKREREEKLKRPEIDPILTPEEVLLASTKRLAGKAARPEVVAKLETKARVLPETKIPETAKDVKNSEIIQPDVNSIVSNETDVTLEVKSEKEETKVRRTANAFETVGALWDDTRSLTPRSSKPKKNIETKTTEVKAAIVIKAETAEEAARTQKVETKKATASKISKTTETSASKLKAPKRETVLAKMKKYMAGNLVASKKSRRNVYIAIGAVAASALTILGGISLFSNKSEGKLASGASKSTAGSEGSTNVKVVIPTVTGPEAQLFGAGDSEVIGELTDEEKAKINDSEALPNNNLTIAEADPYYTDATLAYEKPVAVSDDSVEITEEIVVADSLDSVTSSTVLSEIKNDDTLSFDEPVSVSGPKVPTVHIGKSGPYYTGA